MIPKTIHYCWFGGNSKPNLAKKCIKSWKKYCPDYEIIEWNEANFDISSAPLYVRQAYEAKKWAFVTDYVRLKVVYDNGGIYLDTDVELIKPLDDLLQYDAYFGFEDGKYIATGLGFGAIKNAKVLTALMDDYTEIPFIKSDGSIDKTTCPMRNTNVLLKYGLLQNNKLQILSDNILILPSDYLCPINFSTESIKKTKNTLSIHWFSASWFTKADKKEHRLQKKQNKKYIRIDRIHNITHLPNKILKKMLGERKYNKLKESIKGKL